MLAFEEAKKVAPNYDVYYLERDFREWWSNIGKPAPDNLTKAFVGFCKARHKRKPYPYQHTHKYGCVGMW